MAKNVIQVPEAEALNADGTVKDGYADTVATVLGTEFHVYARVEQLDDVDGSAADVATVMFAYPEWVEPQQRTDSDGFAVTDDNDQPVMDDGYWRTVTREVDLSKKNRDALDKSLKKYIDASRPAPVRVASTPRASRSKAKTAGPHDGLDMTKVRDWLREAGHDVADRGRVSEKLVEVYIKNHPSEVTPS